jgi:flavin-dependent dehydrogenase
MSRLKLEDHATVIVIGAGPAGSFFAIHLLREARKLDKVVHVTLVEKKSVPECPGAELPTRHREALRQGCAYCAGGLSPRLLEALASSQISLHKGVPQSEVKRIEIWAQWKAIALHVPSGKKMLSVYRGTRPQIRDKPFLNFDSCLLDHALDEGAKVITGEVIEIVRAPDTGKPRVLTDAEPGSLEADLVVYAAGVNQIPGMELENSRLVKSLKEMMPGFVPPRARRTLIFELDAGQEVTGRIRNDIFFMLHGSDGLDLEMVSIVPKGRFITISLIGRSIDSAKPKDRLDIIDRFLQIPHIKRLLPRGGKLSHPCICSPNIVLGVASNPFGDRIAVIGDAATSHPYKDGIFSAWTTASGLVQAILHEGIDRESLKIGYEPIIRAFAVDNWCSKWIFMLIRVAFGNPVLSRIIYQAVLTERKTRPQGQRRLEKILWNVASGEDKYRNILASMLHPATLWAIAAGGGAITARNYLTERLLGLKWGGFQRATTGVFKEEREAKRLSLKELVGEHPEFERMYAIRIQAPRERIFEQLGKFGDPDRGYFLPKRMIEVKGLSRSAHGAVTTIHYKVSPKFLSFFLELIEIHPDRRLIYRVRDGFPAGGVLVFDIEGVNKASADNDYLLSLYVAFDFPRALLWRVGRLIFPAFTHDVLWNHGLCKLKDILEAE